MANLFRKMRYYFIGNDKISNYISYAIGEIILVVIGILIAISVNGWNEERKREQLEHKILLSLKAEFEESRELLSATMKAQKNVLTRSNALLKIYQSEMPLPGNDSIKKLVKYGALAWHREELITGSYNVLINSGNSELVKNEKLMELLAEFYSVLQAGFEDHETSMHLKNELLHIVAPVMLSLSEPSLIKNTSPETTSNPKETDAIKYLFEQDAFFGLLYSKTYLEKLRYEYQEDLLSRITSILETITLEL